jgi:hypothetical protein
VPAVLLYAGVPLVIAGLMGCYLALARRAAGEIGFPLDDSWIHARFAENLSQGLGFSFNPGEPTSTTTAALWTLLLAGAYRITHEFPVTSFALNGVLCALLCVVVYHLSLTMHASRWVALLAASAVAVTIPLPWWALSGMEPPLYAFLSLLGILLHVRLRQATGPRAILPTAVFALAGLARPECLLLFPLAMADRLVMARWRDLQPRWFAGFLRGLALHVPVFAVIVAPLFLYNHRVTGYWLPSSFYSKLQRESVLGALAMERVAPIFTAPAKQIWSLLVLWAKDNLLLVVPFLFGLGWLARSVFSPDSRHRSLLIPMLLVGQPIAWALVAGYRDAGFQSQRYVATLNALFLLLGVVGASPLIERVRQAQSNVVLRAALVVLVLGASLARQPSAAKIYALNVKNITDMQVTIARWLRDNAPRGSLLAVNDVGAIGVISGDPVLDLQGLVTPEALAPRAESYRQFAAGQAPLALSEFVFARRPDYLVIFPEWYPEMDARRDLLTPVFAVQLKNNITCGKALMVVYRTVWARADEEP